MGLNDTVISDTDLFAQHNKYLTFCAYRTAVASSQLLKTEV